MPSGSKPRLLSWPFALAFVASFVNSMVIHMYVHLPGQLRQLGADELRIGVIMSSMALTGIIGRPLVGSAMDLHGRRVVAITGGVLHVGAAALYLSYDVLGPLVYLARIIHGLAEACLFSVMFTIAADLVPPQRRTEGMALFGVSGVVPIGLGSFLGDVVLASGSYTHLFLTGLGLAAFGLVVSFPIPDTRPRTSASEPAGRGFFAAAADPPLRPLWLVGFGFAFAVSSAFTFLKTFVLTTGVAEVSHFFLPYGLTAMALRVGLGWVPDRFGPERTLLPSVAALAGGLWLLGSAESAATVVAAGVLTGVGHGYAFPILSALVVGRCRASERGSAITLFTALFSAGMLLGGPTLGAVAEATDHRVMFRVAAAVALVAVGVFFVWDRRRAPWPVAAHRRVD